MGFKPEFLQDILLQYENEYGIRAYLVDKTGIIEISTNHTGYNAVNLFYLHCNFGYLKDELLEKGDIPAEIWYSYKDKRGFVLTRYIPNLT